MADAGVGDLHEDLAGPRRSDVDLADLQHLRPPGLTNSNRLCFEHAAKSNARKPTVQPRISCYVLSDDRKRRELSASLGAAGP